MRPSTSRQGAAPRDAHAVRAVRHRGPAGTDSCRRNGPSTCQGHRRTAASTAGHGALVARRADDGSSRAESAAGPPDHPASTAWTWSASGAAGTTLDGPATAPRLTCPRFVTTPGGRHRSGCRAGVPSNGRNTRAGVPSNGHNTRAGHGGSRWAEPGEGTGTRTAEHVPGTVRCTGPAGRPHAAVAHVPGRPGQRGTDGGADGTAHGRACHLCETASRRPAEDRDPRPAPLRSAHRAPPRPVRQRLRRPPVPAGSPRPAGPDTVRRSRTGGSPPA